MVDVAGVTYAYDYNGNMTDRGSQDITWDAENRPVTVTGDATFYYDGDGNRYKKTENNETTVYVNKYYEINTDTEEETRYYYFGGRMVLFKKGGLYGDYHVVNQNHLGGASGTMYFGTDSVSTVSYEPFGATRSSTGTMPTDKLFTGQRPCCVKSNCYRNGSGCVVNTVTQLPVDSICLRKRSGSGPPGSRAVLQHH